MSLGLNAKMASDLDFVEYVVDQIENAGVVSYRKMFGEFAVYCNGKVDKTRNKRISTTDPKNRFMNTYLHGKVLLNRCTVGPPQVTPLLTRRFWSILIKYPA